MIDFSKYSNREIKNLVVRLVPFGELTDVVPFNILCPFHDNRHTPSAKFYQDDDGIVTLFCFSEHRKFTSYDYLSLVKGVNPLTYIKQRYSDKDLNNIIEVIKESGIDFDLDNDKIDTIHNCWVDSLEEPIDFIDSIYKGYHLDDDILNNKN